MHSIDAVEKFRVVMVVGEEILKNCRSSDIVGFNEGLLDNLFSWDSKFPSERNLFGDLVRNSVVDSSWSFVVDINWNLVIDSSGDLFDNFVGLSLVVSSLNWNINENWNFVNDFVCLFDVLSSWDGSSNTFWDLVVDSSWDIDINVVWLLVVLDSWNLNFDDVGFFLIDGVWSGNVVSDELWAVVSFLRGGVSLGALMRVSKTVLLTVLILDRVILGGGSSIVVRVRVRGVVRLRAGTMSVCGEVTTIADVSVPTLSSTSGLSIWAEDSITAVFSVTCNIAAAATTGV